MASGIQTKKLAVRGMTCPACQNRIEQALRGRAGIKSIRVRYQDGTAEIAYDSGRVSMSEISARIEALGYQVPDGNAAGQKGASRTFVLLGVIFVLFILLRRFEILNLLAPGRLADADMGYGLLFVIGLLTSVHCIAMCGGINLSQCMPRADLPAGRQGKWTASFAPALRYNLGRVISYTAIGVVLGAAGQMLGGGAGTGFPVAAQALFKFSAGLLMVVMGINLLGLFPFLQKLNPRLPKGLTRLRHAKRLKNKGPLIIGLLNGLMPCGPLQSMQIAALASGGPLAGGLSMLFFCLGTAPLMLGLGSIVSALGRRFTAKVMTAGALLVVVLGLAMFSQGWQLWGAAGISSAAGSTASQAADAAFPDTDVQIINSTLSARGYPDITVEVGRPVEWTIHAPRGSITGCNNRLYIGEYDIEHTFSQGENVIAFTPDKTGKFQYTCWMGMLTATITVTE